MIPLTLVYEDQISELVMMKLIEHTGKFHIGPSYSGGGYGYIKDNIKGFNEAAKGHPFFILTDLDTTECATVLINNWLRRAQHPNLIFRIAVREVEAWLLADIDGFSKYTGISKTNFHDNPEEIADPKAALLSIMKKCRKREIREDILPKDEYAKVGPDYNGRLGEYVIDYWNINRAVRRSDSLKRALNNLNNFQWIVKN